MKLCARCKEYKQESEYNWRDLHRGYLQSGCRSCQQERGRERYTINTENVKEINRLSRQRAREEARNFVYEYLAKKTCSDCGERDIAVLTFDHVGDQKKMNISDMVTQGYAIETIKTELEKTEVTCFNCHMRREQKRRGVGRFGRFTP